MLALMANLNLPKIPTGKRTNSGDKDGYRILHFFYTNKNLRVFILRRIHP